MFSDGKKIRLFLEREDKVRREKKKKAEGNPGTLSFKWNIHRSVVILSGMDNGYAMVVHGSDGDDNDGYRRMSVRECVCKANAYLLNAEVFCCSLLMHD